MLNSVVKIIKGTLVILLLVTITSSVSRGQSPSPQSNKFLVCDSIEISATLPVVLNKKLPEYPRLAREYRIQGKVEMIVIVSENGFVDSIRILQGNPILAEAARKATLDWKFRAGLEGGIPVKSEVPVTYSFKME